MLQKIYSIRRFVPWAELILPIAGLLIAGMLASRAFVIGYVAGLFFILYQKNKQKRVLLFFVVITATLAFFLAFFIKSDSTLGRLLIYKISGKLFADHWLHGIGWGNFKHTYLYYQATYFKAGNYTAKELLLADNTYFAFNDYWQFIIETGLKGWFVLAFGLILLFFLIKKAYKNHNNPLLNAVMAQCIATAVAACFTYVFNKPVFQVIAIVCVTIITFYACKNQFKYARLFIPVTGTVLTVICLAFPYYFSWTYFNAVRQIPEIRELYRAGFKREVKQKLQEWSTLLIDHSEYLTLLSRQYLDNGDAQRAIPVLQQLVKQSVSSYNYLRLANACELNKSYREAEAAYQTAIFMVPNRFSPRRDLFRLYKTTGQLNKAKASGRAILVLPVKIPSAEVNQIKNEVRNGLMAID